MIRPTGEERAVINYSIQGSGLFRNRDHFPDSVTLNKRSVPSGFVNENILNLAFVVYGFIKFIYKINELFSFFAL